MATPATAPAAAPAGRVHYTATLVRGESYTFENTRFVRGEPKVVAKELAEILRDKIEEVVTTGPEPEVLERELFLVEEVEGAPVVVEPETTAVRSRRRPVEA